MKNKAQLDGMPVWFDGKSINEALCLSLIHIEMCIRDRHIPIRLLRLCFSGRKPGIYNPLRSNRQ